jgi:hypothetical protein
MASSDVFSIPDGFFASLVQRDDCIRLEIDYYVKFN